MTATLPTDTVPSLVGIAIEARDRNWSNGKILTEITRLLAQPATAAPVRTVVDCASVAWDEYSTLGRGAFEDEHAAELNNAARELIRPLLVAAWRKRGFGVRLVDKAAFYALPEPDADDVIPVETYWAVRQEAADGIDLGALLTATDLTHEYTAHYQD